MRVHIGQNQPPYPRGDTSPRTTDHPDLGSRNGNVFGRFDALADQVRRLLDVDEAVIDGEVIAVTPPEFTRRDFGTVTRTRPVSRLRALFPH